MINEDKSLRKKEIGMGKKQKYGKDQLLSIAKDHIEHFTSKRYWNEYAKKNKLPIAPTFENHFGSWNEVKELLTLEPLQATGSPGFSKDEIEIILLSHGENIENRTQWDEYAKEHNLPTYKTIRKHYTWDEILEFGNKKTYKNKYVSPEELLEIAYKHKETFLPASQRAWGNYARDFKLPSYNSYVRKFDTWKLSKLALLKWIDKKAQE